MIGVYSGLWNARMGCDSSVTNAQRRPFQIWASLYHHSSMTDGLCVPALMRIIQNVCEAAPGQPIDHDAARFTLGST